MQANFPRDAAATPSPLSPTSCRGAAAAPAHALRVSIESRQARAAGGRAAVLRLAALMPLAAPVLAVLLLVASPAVQAQAKAPAAGKAPVKAPAKAPAPLKAAAKPQADPDQTAPGKTAAIQPAVDLPPAELCAEFGRRLPNVTPENCQEAALVPTGARSVEGRAILQRDVLPDTSFSGDDGAARRPAPARRVLVVGGIHGDELSSAALVIHWIGHAMRDGADIQWRLVPLMNPDGAMKAQPTRTNARGVDLNRNFPTPDWARIAPKYWKERTRRDPRRFPGHAPLSEPESRWLHDEMERFKPHLIVSVHAPYGVLDFDGPSVPPERLGRLYLDRVGIFPGSLGNYGGVHKNIPVVTIELSSAIRTPTEAEMRQMWLDLMRWIEERLPADMAAAPEGPNAASIDCMAAPKTVVEVVGVACRDQPLDTAPNAPARGASAPAASPGSQGAGMVPHLPGPRSIRVMPTQLR